MPGTRTPKRIKILLKRLKKTWNKNPSFPMGFLIKCSLEEHPDLLSLSDEAFFVVLEQTKYKRKESK